jgi:hypothetical protein
MMAMEKSKQMVMAMDLGKPLFSSPRQIGKRTIAKISAKAIRINKSCK